MKIIGNRSRCLSLEQLKIRMTNKQCPLHFCSLVQPSGIVVYLGLTVMPSVSALDLDYDDLFLPSYHSRPLSSSSYNDLLKFAHEVGCPCF